MKPTLPTLTSKAAPFALAILIAGCPSTPLCEVDEAQIVINEGSTPSVPDQVVGGCYHFAVARTYANQTELDLILHAESLPSSIGPDWFNASEQTGFGTRVPEAINEEALSYYADRLRSLRAAAGDGSVPILAGMGYSAEVVQPVQSDSGNAAEERVVRLGLSYEEWGSFILGGLSGEVIYIEREVVFNRVGDVVEIRGDGEVQQVSGN